MTVNAPAATRLAESIPLAEAVRGAPSGRRMRIRLIDAGWGSSGYYSREVLERAAKAGVFGAGMHMYLDHPTVTEQAERPERSVRDLAAVLTGPAVYDQGGLYAEAQVFAPFQQVLAEQAEHIGVSIRAVGTAEPGEAEGRRGMLITELTEGVSVDFVTAAGRGGQIVEVLESARALTEARNIGGWLESRLHAVFTQISDDMYGEGRLTREERIGLSSAIGDALGAFVARVEADGPPEPTSADMAETTLPAPPAKPLEVTRVSGPQTGAPTGGPTTEISEADRLRTELAETRQKLAEAELRIAQLGDQGRDLEDTKRSLEEARRENLKLRANDAARAKATATLASSTLPQTAHARVVEAVTGDNVPLGEDGALDEAKLTESIKGAIEAERRYLARFAEEAGIGSVRGLGSSGDPNEMTESDLQSGLKDVFGRLGMDATTADLAAKGR
ncbi:hypothetical protein [Spongiactinospora sp. TRM90649]|uniref:hypothetical protein n=1 Tax=Spongiactinospora sp. TRM90649 TaxID=3031114 RepID=UPI0023F92F10|nr:hypothetical protein [Spongiactinospora sp. TRM90649]MDF5758604.1 hypothetical protein [Spongiactinospora sp. TRM90649]